MSVLKLHLLVDIQQQVGEFFLSITSCPSIIYFRRSVKLVHRKNVVAVTLTTDIMFLLFTCMHFWAQGILQRWSECTLTAYEVVRDRRMFEKHWSRWLGTCFST
jgi:hypothetical protein